MLNLYRAISNSYANVKGYAERFPSIGEGDYKPAYACVESKTKLEIKAEPYANITFKNERDVPLVLDDEGNPTSDIIGGYMPVGRHYGFIYNEYTNARTIAHELAHGTNALHHTFSPESETFYTTKETDNLMDYHAGKTLTHTQWQWSHEKHRNVLGFLDDEGKSEMRENTSIKWLGDWLEGYFYDDLEKLVENDLSLYDKVALNFDSYYEKSAKENVGLESWSVRKSAHTSNICGKIFDKISKRENPQFTLHEKGIFTQKYTLEGKEYRVAILSYAEKISLDSKNIKLTSYSKLADNKYIKAGYTKRSGGYGIIAFFDGDKPTMIIQIIDFEPQLAVEKWLNYLSLILPSSEQKNDDGDNIKGFEIHPIEKLIEIWNALFKSEDFKKLQQIEELTPKEIREYREFIKTLPEDERADWYLELQKKVPYHNQRDNESLATEEDVENNSSWLNDGDTAGDIMCNLTSEAMCLEMLGIEFPCDECDSDCDRYKQFEDYLECLRMSNGYEHRGTSISRKKIAINFNVNQMKIDIWSNERETILSHLYNALQNGKSILISMSFGHIVRLQAITDEGLVIDDPYGKIYDYAQTGATPKYYKRDKYDQRNGNNLGKDNLWTWSDLQTNNIFIKYAEIYSIND